ncbi:MAG: hypothetical protein WDA47_03815 [Bacilli bacterium]
MDRMDRVLTFLMVLAAVAVAFCLGRVTTTSTEKIHYAPVDTELIQRYKDTVNRQQTEVNELWGKIEELEDEKDTLVGIILDTSRLLKVLEQDKLRVEADVNE